MYKMVSDLKQLKIGEIGCKRYRGRVICFKRMKKSGFGTYRIVSNQGG